MNNNFMPAKPADWGTVNLGVDVLQGHGEQNQPGKADFIKNHPSANHKQQFNPGRNQELNLPAWYVYAQVIMNLVGVFM